MKIPLPIALLACFLASSLFAADASKSPSEVTFVASLAELKAAEDEKDNLKGLAVANEFYRSAPETVRTGTEELVRFILKKFYRPVFFYGLGLDVPRLMDLFGLGKPNCTPIVMFGVFPTAVIDSSMSVGGRMASGDVWICDRWMYENEYRALITDTWLQYKKEFSEEGYGVTK